MVVKKELGDKIVKKIRQKKPAKQPEPSDVDSASEEVLFYWYSDINQYLRNPRKNVKNGQFENHQIILTKKLKKRMMTNAIHK